MLGWILILVLVFMLIGALPIYPYSRNWRYYPSGTITLILIVLLILLLAGMI
jgi:hypothetical protein